MASRRILVLGATGGTGSSLVEQAVAAGYDVTVLVRDEARLPSSIAKAVRVVSGDLVTSPSILDEALPGQEVVISTLGVGKLLKSNGLIAHSAPAIVAAMRRHDVRRLVFTSAFGIGVTRRDTPLLPRLAIATMLRDVYADKELGERAILESDLAWTMVHPVSLSDAPRSGRYRAGERLSLRGFPRIARGDVAEFLLRQVEDPEFVRKSVLVAAA
jgi:uncharacterized protein YbjT (DUF2867 family)